MPDKFAILTVTVTVLNSDRNDLSSLVLPDRCLVSDSRVLTACVQSQSLDVRVTLRPDELAMFMYTSGTGARSTRDVLSETKA